MTKYLKIAFFFLFMFFVVSAFAQDKEWETQILNANSLFMGMEFNKAAVSAEKALAIAKKNFPPDDPKITMSMNLLAEIYKLQDKVSESEAIHKQALSIREKNFKPDDVQRIVDMAESLNNLANLYRSQKRYVEAESLNKRAVTILKKYPDQEDYEIKEMLMDVLEKSVRLYRQMGKEDEAKKAEKRLKDLEKEDLVNE